MKKLDFHDDPYLLVKHAAQIPDFVRAYVPARDEQSLPGDCFALQVLTKTGELKRYFRTQNKAETWLSAFYLTENANRMPVEAVKTAAHFITKAASGYEMELPHGMPEGEDVLTNMMDESILEKLEQIKMSESAGVLKELGMQGAVPLLKVASGEKLHDSWYGIVRGNQRLYPLHSEALIKKATAWFIENVTDLDPPLRKEFVTKLARAAYDFGVSLPDTGPVADYLSAGYTDPDLLSAYMYMRKSAAPEVLVDLTGLGLETSFKDGTKTASTQMTYPKALDKLMAVQDRVSPEKFASALCSLDRMAGVATGWDRTFPDPYKTVFSLIKTADYSWVSKDGDSITGSKLVSMSKSCKEKLHGHLSQNVIEAFEENAIETFNALPNPEKELILSCMKKKCDDETQEAL